MANIIDINNRRTDINDANEQTDFNNANELTDVNNTINAQIDVINTNGQKSTCVEIKMEPSVDEEKKWERDGTIYQVLMSLCANVVVLGPAMGFGYSAVAEPAMTAPKTDDLQLDADQANWMATVSALGTPFGCLISSLVMGRGRKISLLVTSLISLAGWVTIYMSNSYEQILVGRTISGISTGMASVPTTVYSAEIAGPKWRGTMVTWTSITTAVGVLIVYIFGYIFKDDWRLVALMCALFPVVAIALILLAVPESPLWLRDQNRPDEALEIMKKFRGVPKDQPAPAELLFELKPRVQKKNQNLLQHLIKRSSLVPFAIMLMYFFFQQFSGIFIVIYNAVDIMDKSGIQVDPYIGAVLIGIARFLTSLLTAGVSRKYGRRIPSLISGVGMTIFMGVLSLYLYLAENGTVMSDNGVTPVACMMLYIITSTLGYLVIPFAMVGEVFPSKVKDILSGVTVAIGYIFSAITVKTYPDMLRLMSMHGVFLFFAIISFIGVVFILLFLPETKGKTLREIEDMFCKKKVFELPAEGVVGERVASNAVGLLTN
ncbi:facilitated trehalose transporter Tret1-2 homolog isoform X1 [Cataglyphis hispanica]|uniref:facilitated trehalose transporter Tret1-2 homolog isoform X1 n=1 Tax=Cataglyphis hispanica TaxID=1086592 RepID=UPI00217FEA7C|nr:facilitated trehalose transporter Tret1-2 homolog isoform X1 [Cataglyphis hispanica]